MFELINCADVVWVGFALLFLLDAFRIRGRIFALTSLGVHEAEVSSHRFVCAPGVRLSPQTRQRAMGHLTANKLGAMELLPQRPSLSLAWSMGCHIDPDAHRRESSRPGDTGCHAFLAPNDVLDQLGAPEITDDMAQFVSLSREVRRRVKAPHDLVIASDLIAVDHNPYFDPEVLSIRLGGSIAAVAMGIPVLWGLIGLGLWLAPVGGSLALLCFVLQQPIAVLGSPFVVSGAWWMGFLRPFRDGIQWLQLIRRHRGQPEELQALRQQYAARLSGGTAAFFHDKRTTCPMCDHSNLTDLFTLPDLYQGKPGRCST